MCPLLSLSVYHHEKKEAITLYASFYLTIGAMGIFNLMRFIFDPFAHLKPLSVGHDDPFSESSEPLTLSAALQYLLHGTLLCRDRLVPR
ncbi:TPA: hypothetical protein DEB29_03545 [Candidatus Wolfebacteria bacterium]|nr:hypothetical protein [Candidatus Wolfebacteria bacterium]